MANTTESKETVSRQEFATYLRNLADQFESDGDAQIQIGNKSVTVHPAKSVRREVTVIERSAILRGDKEALDLEVKWKKNREGGRSDGERESESEDEYEDVDADEDAADGVDENGNRLGSE